MGAPRDESRALAAGLCSGASLMHTTWIYWHAAAGCARCERCGALGMEECRHGSGSSIVPFPNHSCLCAELQNAFLQPRGSPSWQDAPCSPRLPARLLPRVAAALGVQSTSSPSFPPLQGPILRLCHPLHVSVGRGEVGDPSTPSHEQSFTTGVPRPPCEAQTMGCTALPSAVWNRRLCRRGEVWGCCKSRARSGGRRWQREAAATELLPASPGESTALRAERRRKAPGRIDASRAGAGMLLAVCHRAHGAERQPAPVRGVEVNAAVRRGHPGTRSLNVITPGGPGDALMLL